MASFQDVLTPSIVTKIVSRIRMPGNVLSRHFGVHIGGPNVDQTPGRTYSYDIYDNVRTVANGRQPGVPAGTVAPNPVGNIPVALTRSAEKLALDYSRLSMIRAIGQNAGVHDRMGAKYVEKQAGTLNQRQNNWREVFFGGLLRGGQLGYAQSGDDLIPVLDTSGVLMSVDMRIPASNKLIGGSFAAGLQMETGSNIVTAAWSDPATLIVSQLYAMKAGFERQTGGTMTDVWCNSGVFVNVLSNTQVKAFGGTANVAFTEFDLVNDKGPDGTDTGLQFAKLKGIPWVKWHVYDGGLAVGTVAAPTTPTFTKLIPDDYIMAHVDYDGSWLRGVEGSELVKANDLAAATEEYGFHSWVMERADPARFELHTLQSFFLELNVPKSVIVARVQ